MYTQVPAGAALMIGLFVKRLSVALRKNLHRELPAIRGANGTIRVFHTSMPILALCQAAEKGIDRPGGLSVLV